MQKGATLQFICQECNSSLQFSVFSLEKESKIVCEKCSLLYDFKDEVLLRQLKKFENLCRAIQLSKEILSKTVIGIFSEGDREVKIPFDILLTRLNSTLNLMVGDRSLAISFRLEPYQDLPSIASMNNQELA